MSGERGYGRRQQALIDGVECALDYGLDPEPEDLEEYRRLTESGRTDPEEKAPEKGRKAVRWIVPPVLPPEPGNGACDMDDLEEYIVVIEGAEKATALFYAGDGEWCRDGAFYRVEKWMPFPEA